MTLSFVMYELFLNCNHFRPDGCLTNAALALCILFLAKSVSNVAAAQSQCDQTNHLDHIGDKAA